MRWLMLFTLIMSVACGDKSSTFKMGKTTRSELVSVKGDPLKEEAIPTTDGKVLIYENDEKYQLKGDVVVNSFKNPIEQERAVIFWKHKFKDCVTSSKSLPREISAHTPEEIELSCAEMGLSVIYTNGSDTVSRVVEYEVK